MLTVDAGRYNKLVGLTKSYGEIGTQLDVLHSLPAPFGRYGHVEATRRYNLSLELASASAAARAGGINLFNNIVFGDELVDVVSNPGGTQIVGFGDTIRDGGGYWSGVGEVGKGYGDAGVSFGQGIYQVNAHPIDTLQGIGTALRHPFLTIEAIVDDFYDKSQTLRGQGNIVGDILIGLATGGITKVTKEAGLIGKITGKLQKLLNKSKYVEDAQAIVARVAQEQANKGIDALRKIMSQGERAAFDANTTGGSRFLGSAVHKATAEALEYLHPGRFKYNRIGPDFSDILTQELIELTTPGQVAAHIAKGGAYAAARYATYILPK